MKKNIILMYHGITSSTIKMPPNREIGAELYDVRLEDFVAQLDFLKSQSYPVVGLDQINEKGTAPRVLLTFDDGEENNFSLAFPALRERGLTAAFFIIAGRIGNPGYMTGEQIKQLHTAGMSIGSHGLSHEILTDLKETQLEQELIASKTTLERNLGFPIDMLSIPRGFCDNRVILMARQLGYEHIFISEKPMHLTEPCFDRIAVKGSWSLTRFKQAIAGEIPLPERIGNGVKTVAKFILREPGYNGMRRALIRLKNILT